MNIEQRVTHKTCVVLLLYNVVCVLFSALYISKVKIVPDYELVHLRVLNKRSAAADSEHKEKQVHLTAFGEQIQLNLKPNKEFNDRIAKLKMYMAETVGNGKLKYVEEPQSDQSFYNQTDIHFISYEKEKQDIGQTYHDEEKLAAVLINHNPVGHIQLDGTIGNDLVIKPMPDSAKLSSSSEDADRDDDELFLDEDEKMEMMLRKKSTKKQRISSISPSSKSSSRRPTKKLNYNIPKLKNLRRDKNLSELKNAHIVYKKRQPSENHTSDFAELEAGMTNFGARIRNNTQQARSKRTKRQTPDQIWPEVLLVVDYDSYLLHGANSRDVKRYFISFWNGVDLRYKLLSNPSIRVSLAGMIVAKDRDATPYLERNRLRTPNADAVDAAGALTDMGKYLYREDRLPTYDLAVVITKLDMCRKRFENGRCNRGTAGFAYVGGACVVNKRLEKVNSVAIIEDSGGFSGIIVAAHEVGHLLGCVHDGSPPPSYLGGPGATRCPWEDGFIMSDLRHTERGFRWSSCSIEQFKHFLNGETATCLYNYPHENQLLPRVLPGTMLSLDEQCKRDRGTNACFKDARVCAQLFCFDSASGYCVSYRPAAEGSPCGDGQVCRNGKCTAELENIIPDYTHVTQTVVNRSPIARSDTVPTPRRSNSRYRNRLGILRPTTQHDMSPSLPTYSSPPTHIDDSGENDSNENCVDVVENLGGSMSCKQFLEKFGYRYCHHNYIKSNCCASRLTMCNGE
ncbi:A disintegrin and metalloproteinase with thrombospondin motifs 1-like protein [Dinothrombium tinctorium]|uniref:A disintegrin and metalloproteinase with thrombospondin motifs 1-like protein n=1 Tax=Dinothrombium tinctorium TaxID=1965070 RepID=A0A3S3SR26_9ACAR|nr:A disintegrin and metalloproteinase with thrombospondin motifs 1-like protein [Dinothrombium tinctorium]